MKTVTQDMLYRQALIKYAQKYGVTKAAMRYKTNRQYIYRWLKRYDGTLASLADKSHRPHHHPNEHTPEELKLIADMRRRNPNVWKRNFNHVEQLFDYGSAVRKVMYTTNAVESINSSFRKVTKKGAFPNENDLLKLLYLRITELYKKWNGSKVQNWAMVRNQLSTDDKIKARIEKYEHLI